MINAFKQVRLTNINLSGANGRIEAGASGSFAFLSELNASGSDLSNAISSNFNTLSGNIANTGTNLYDLITGVSGVLDNKGSTDLSTLSGALNTKIDEVSGNLNNYIDDRISGVIDLAPAALDTLNELAAALGDDENFASNLVNTLGNLSGSLSSDLSTASGVLDSRITDEVSTLNTSLANVSGYFSSSNKQFTVNVANPSDSISVAFPGAAFSSVPTVQATLEGSDVMYGLLIKDRSVSGCSVFFSDTVQENGVVLNIFASNQ
jgi:hypothetical protein